MKGYDDVPWSETEPVGEKAFVECHEALRPRRLKRQNVTHTQSPVPIIAPPLWAVFIMPILLQNAS